MAVRKKLYLKKKLHIDLISFMCGTEESFRARCGSGSSEMLKVIISKRTKLQGNYGI
jgi:hypothetical protein